MHDLLHVPLITGRLAQKLKQVATEQHAMFCTSQKRICGLQSALNVNHKQDARGIGGGAKQSRQLSYGLLLILQGNEVQEERLHVLRQLQAAAHDVLWGAAAAAALSGKHHRLHVSPPRHFQHRHLQKGGQEQAQCQCVECVGQWSAGTHSASRAWVPQHALCCH